MTQQHTISASRVWLITGSSTGFGSALAASTMIKIVEHPEPPLRLALGANALEMMRKKLAEVSHEWEKWETTSMATAFPLTTIIPSEG